MVGVVGRKRTERTRCSNNAKLHVAAEAAAAAGPRAAPLIF